MFCASSDFKSGFCCSENTGCSDDIRDAAYICSTDLSNKSVTCPNDSRCGYSKLFDINVEWTRIFGDSTRSGFQEGEQCSYILNIEDYQEGETIEIDVVQLSNAKVSVYQGED